MNKFGWDLPPGVSINDIPGNRPEDEAEELFWEEFAKKLDEEKLEHIELNFPSAGETIPLEELWDNPDFVKLVQIARDMGFTAGYNQGCIDGAMELSSRMMDEAEEQS